MANKKATPSDKVKERPETEIVIKSTLSAESNRLTSDIQNLISLVNNDSTAIDLAMILGRIDQRCKDMDLFLQVNGLIGEEEIPF